MIKGYYYFGECGAFERFLIIGGLLSIAVSAVFFFFGGWEVLIRPGAIGSNSYSIWCVFFLLLASIMFLIDAAIHKICRDVATLLKEVEDSKRE